MDNRIAPDEARVQKIEFRAMGSHMLAAIESDDPEATDLLAQVPKWFAEWEQSLSRFKDDSELSQLNRADSASSPVQVSETLWAVLQTALAAANDTGGLVTPTLLNALEQAGYNANFDSIKEKTGKDAASLAQEMAGHAELMGSTKDGVSGAASSNAVTFSTWRGIRTFPSTRSVSLPKGMRLDFGGVAKGWAADRAVNRLAKYGSALVDAGGDIAISGPQDRRVDWPVGVDAPTLPGLEIPAGSDGLLELLAVRHGGVATSGRDYRRWQQDGQWRHHIIDPRTGQPAMTDVLTATVVAPTACRAEIAAKVVLLLGGNKGLPWLDAQASLAGLIVLDHGEVLRSGRFDNYIWSNENGN